MTWHPFRRVKPLCSKGPHRVNQFRGLLHVVRISLHGRNQAPSSATFRWSICLTKRRHLLADLRRNSATIPGSAFAGQSCFFDSCRTLLYPRFFATSSPRMKTMLSLKNPNGAALRASSPSLASRRPVVIDESAFSAAVVGYPGIAETSPGKPSPAREKTGPKATLAWRD
jgi:hypothetical protein